MKILSIILIGIASWGVVTELKSDIAAIDSIPRYVVIAVFYIWSYLAQKYSESNYRGGIISVSGVFLFGFGIIGLVSSIFAGVDKYSFSENSGIVMLLLVFIFTVSILLIVFGHRRHRELEDTINVNLD
jgi:hypothetical protein